MRAILIAALLAAGIGLVGTSGAAAAPANGIVIDEAVAAGQPTEQVRHRYWHHRRFHRWHWRHHHRRHCVHRRLGSGLRCWR